MKIVMGLSRDDMVLLHPMPATSGMPLRALPMIKLSERTKPVDGCIESRLPPTLDRYLQVSRPIMNLKKSKIAIVGMSGRFPSANNTAAFWDILLAGRDVHKPVPRLRWDANTHVDTSGIKRNTSATPFGCWLDEPGKFDARFFGISLREAPQMDPAQRLVLLTAYEAIEHAGIVPGSTPSTQRSRCGVFYGVTSNDWMETNSAQNIDTYYIPGGNRAFISGRVNYHFKFSGPSYSVDTACSSSLAAIHLACNSLWQGDIDTAVAGGSNVLTNPDMTCGLDKGHFLSHTGNCKTFDDEADGYCRGEGIGSIIMKRVEDAITDNDPILGVIANITTNHSADAASITRPCSNAQQSAFSKVLGSADPLEVSYIEMHGTGTQRGDICEMTSVLQSFAPDSSLHQRSDTQKLFLGSAKANVGHGEAAAGVTSLIKVLLMLQNNTIPPHCGIKSKVNKNFPIDLSTRNVRIAEKAVEWQKPCKKLRRALINNFSAAGGNTALLLEEADTAMTPRDIDPRNHYVVTLSAKTSSSLRGNASALLAFLRRPNAASITPSSLSYTTTARRTHYQYRMAISGSTICELEAGLTREIDSNDIEPSARPVITFAFAGQGTQYIGMGKDLFATISSFRSNIRRYDRLSQSQGFPSILPMICNERSEDVNQSPMTVQLATICLQLALVRLWASWGVTPQSVIGHSLGHYAALNAAGVISDAETIFLVGIRARQLQDVCCPDTHSMLAVKSWNRQRY